MSNTNTTHSEKDNPLLHVQNLTTRFYTDEVVEAVDDISYKLNAGEALGIVGESGSGKSVSVRSLVGLIKSPGKIEQGQVYWSGEDILSMTDSELRGIRGDEIAMVFQNARSAFDSTYTIGEQIIEAIQEHRSLSNPAARDRACDLLEEVGIPSPETRLDQYPHEYSGGMAQRAMIAMSLAAEPSLLIADEPTTGLDVSVQAQIVELFKQLRRERNMSLILISHDLGVVSQVCERILLMYGGRIVERGTRRQLLESPRHPYTREFLNSIPDVDCQNDITPIEGSPPNLSDPPAGCRFHPRCPIAEAGRCDDIDPPSIKFDDGHTASCHAYTEAYDRSAGNDSQSAKLSPTAHQEGTVLTKTEPGVDR
jgi:oligopeptide/dipeptide ABC transporter ATP-binding protein